MGVACLQGVPGAGAEGPSALPDVLYWAIAASQHNRFGAIGLQVPARQGSRGGEEMGR